MRWKWAQYTPLLIYLVQVAVPFHFYHNIDKAHVKDSNFRCAELSLYMLYLFIQGWNNNSFLTNLLV